MKTSVRGRRGSGVSETTESLFESRFVPLSRLVFKFCHGVVVAKFSQSPLFVKVGTLSVLASGPITEYEVLLDVWTETSLDCIRLRGVIGPGAILLQETGAGSRGGYSRAQLFENRLANKSRPPISFLLEVILILTIGVSALFPSHSFGAVA